MWSMRLMCCPSQLLTMSCGFESHVRSMAILPCRSMPLILSRPSVSSLKTDTCGSKGSSITRWISRSLECRPAPSLACSGRDNFVVYENDIRQHNATVEIEHAPVTLGLLMEFGGRAQALSRLLGIEVARAGRQLLDELGREDKVAIWKYGDKVEKLADFSQGHETLDRVFQDLGTPEFSETNLYDALIYVVEQMRPVEGRKAIVLISSGVDTFSKAKYEEG